MNELSNVTAVVALVFMITFFALLAYTDFASKRLYQKITDKKKAPLFYKRLKYIRNCAENMNDTQRKYYRRILHSYRILLILLVFLFLMYFIGNLIK